MLLEAEEFGLSIDVVMESGHRICMRCRIAIDGCSGVFCRKASQQTSILHVAQYRWLTVSIDIRRTNLVLVN